MKMKINKSTGRKDYNFGMTVPSGYICTCMETYDLFTFYHQNTGGYQIIVKKKYFKLRSSKTFLRRAFVIIKF